MLDFTKQELNAVQESLFRRYKDEIELHLADVEVQPDKNSAQIVEQPAIFWNALGCNFVVFKKDHNRFEGLFFYDPHEQYSLSQSEYSDVVNCVSALLRDEADHSRQSQGVYSGSTGADLD